MKTLLLRDSLQELALLNISKTRLAPLMALLENAEHSQSYVVIVDEHIARQDLCIDDFLSEASYVVAIVFLAPVVLTKVLYQRNQDKEVLVCFMQECVASNILLRSAHTIFYGHVQCTYVIFGKGPLGRIEFKSKVTTQLILSYHHPISLSMSQFTGVINFSDQNHRWGYEDCSYDLIDMLVPTYFDIQYQCNYTEVVHTLLRGDSILKQKPWFTKLERRLNQWFVKPDKVVLDLSYLNLHSLIEIPEIYQQSGLFANIATLVLTGNSFTGSLPNLLLFRQVRNLYLNSCSLARIPLELVDFEELTLLSIKDNSISQIPYNSYLNKLEHLEGANCSFEEFPEALFCCDSLTYLGLSKQLTRPALSVNKVFAALKYLDISVNYGSNLFKGQPVLEVLNMNYCNSKTVGQGVFECRELRELHFLGWDDLKELPQQLTQLIALESLSFTINYLQSDSLKILKCLPALKKLYIKIDPHHFRASNLMQNMLYLRELDCFSLLYIESTHVDMESVEMFKSNQNLQKMYWVETDQPQHVVTLFDKTKLAH